MKTITETELKEILRLHKLWIDGDLSGVRADLRGVNLSNANLSEADLSNTDLSYANLSKADLRWADLSNANLSNADLREADLRWADLSYANLSKANLGYAKLSKANLGYADLREADLRGANFINADLTNSNLTEANLSNVDLWDCVGDGVRIRTTKTEKYIINHCDDRCQIGCKNHSLADWAAFNDEYIAKMDDGALDWWHKWRDFVLTEKKGEE